ncbi:MAG TPA: VWA domain-containing protein [Hyphomicrobium sp.]|nr:VWA domain-containing protein [Hyphomicrobium sp.]
MMMIGNLREPRGILLVGATLAALVAAIGFAYQRQQAVVDAVAFVDVTGSMNARDGAGPDAGRTRIDAAQAAIRDLAQRLPCGSRLGLGIFSERRAFLLFGPADVCQNYAAFDGALAELDWRMAWEGDSYVSKGLYDAIAIAGSLKSNVIFLTDGQEAPPLPASGVPDFEGKPGDVKGLVIGVGGNAKVPIPKFDDDGREIGVYVAGDVPNANHHGLPGKGMESNAGWHPRNAPFGGEIVQGDEHLTSMRSAHLKDLAARTGLTFVGLSTESSLSPMLLSHAALRTVTVTSSASIFPATLALLLAAFLYAFTLVMRGARAFPKTFQNVQQQ